VDPREETSHRPGRPSAAAFGFLDDDADLWTPVPVPPPTYTLKAQAPRPAPAVPRPAADPPAQPPGSGVPRALAQPSLTWVAATEAAGTPAPPKAAALPADSDDVNLDSVLARRRAVNG
jgi:hypothetical protein